jgi:hypothetical protein
MSLTSGIVTLVTAAIKMIYCHEMAVSIALTMAVSLALTMALTMFHGLHL